MPKPRSLGSRPGFYLVYLAFYFLPWLSVTPSKADIVVACVAIIVFLPIYFHSIHQQGIRSLWHITAIALIGFICAPFVGSHGVFHVYATVQAAYLRPERSAWIVLLLLSIAFTAFSISIELPWWDICFPLFFGFVTSVGAIFSAEQRERESLIERSRVFDKHLAALEERERIAQDLHDLLGQTLTMVTLKSDVAAKLFDKDPARAKQEINEIRAVSRTALKDVREAVDGMNQTTLEKELRRADQVLLAAGVSLTIKGELPSLTPVKDKTLGLVIREAMTNIVRHARASTAVLSITVHNGDLNLTIEDDGQLDSFTEGSGLSGLRNRIESIGGTVNYENVDSMRISLTLPNWESTA